MGNSLGMNSLWAPVFGIKYYRNNYSGISATLVAGYLMFRKPQCVRSL